ncbi:MAG: hypothetical protein PVI23_10730 [Maricaulaceae bacterium]|jgi:hypothetical protein
MVLRQSHGLVFAALAAFAIAGCASREPAPVSGPGVQSSDGSGSSTGRNASDAVSAARRTTREGVPGAATAPLEDLNLRRNEIPQTLEDVEYVYLADPRPNCRQIREELAALDMVLSQDYDVEEEEKRSLGERGGVAAGDLVVDTIRGVTTDIIPFRSVVREASGAASYERRRSRAFAAGYARRAFLKGVAFGRGCAPPAAPLVVTAPEEDPRVDERETRDRPANDTWDDSTLPPS